jgi:hypothetical protein
VPARKARLVERTRELDPKLQTFDQWLAANKDRIPLESPGGPGSCFRGSSGASRFLRHELDSPGAITR